MTVLLSIDWDFITGDCCEHDHDCCGWCNPTPSYRKVGGRGAYELLRKDWNKRFNDILNLSCDSGGMLWVSECHADILTVVNPSDHFEIYHFDSHSDDSDRIGLCCGSWQSFLPKNTKITRACISQ